MALYGSGEPFEHVVATTWNAVGAVVALDTCNWPEHCEPPGPTTTDGLCESASAEDRKSRLRLACRGQLGT